MPLLFVCGNDPTCCSSGEGGTWGEDCTPEPFWLPVSAEPSRVVPWLPITDACGCGVGCVDPAIPVVMLPPAAVAGDVVVCCVLAVGVAMLTVLPTVEGVLTVVVVVGADMLSVTEIDGVEDTKLLETVDPTAVVGVVVIF